jgi:hypothetical protein
LQWKPTTLALAPADIQDAEGERVRQGFVEHGDFAGCLSIYQHTFSRWSNFFITGMAKERSAQPGVERDRSAGPHGPSEGRGLKKRRTLGLPLPGRL